ncbi:MAG: DUF4394 domain-containing protein [Methyloversatilis sp.]|jgi:hypothetical protein|nr:DUF4394 domain-containing protein [Methyloversatilis sp.]MBP6194395.1 DUF4394 domain-containing protein [Methyloversatilis sp.]MBP9117140.1 DUF4394 domain-containing protein [Methyloversatilis sp.]
MYSKFLIAAASTAAMAHTPAIAADFVGLTTGNQVGTFSSDNTVEASFMSISGLGTGERMLGIDLRPSDNMIYGVSSLNRIYTLNAGTGQASFVSVLDTPVVNAALSYGIDFNPVADFAGAASLRYVSSTGNNYAINADTGAVGNAASSIGAGFSGIAYTGSDAAQTSRPASTSLYYINTMTDTLQIAPSAFNAPTITTVGSLGISGNVIGANGFDIDAFGMGWAALTLDNGDSGLYRIDLATGLATFGGALNANLRGFTAAPFMAPVPEPETWGMLLAGIGLLGVIARRRPGQG